MPPVSLEQHRLDAERIVTELGGTVAWNGTDSPLERIRRAAVNSEQLKKLPGKRFLIDGVLQCDSLAEMYGRPGSHKSFLGVDWTMHISTGLAWQGRAVSQGPVVYFASEGATGLGDRVTAWEKHHAGRLNGHADLFTAPADLPKSPAPVYWIPLAAQLGSSEWGAAAGDYAAEVGAELLIFDTRARNTVGLEENSAKDMGLVVANLDLARERSHACLLLIHHSNAAGERPRGSTVVEGAVDTEVSVRTADGVTTAKLEKQKNGADGVQWRFRPLEVESSIVLDAFEGRGQTSITEAGLAMMDTLRAIHIGDPVSYTRWIDAGDVSKATFSRQLKLLVEHGFVVQDGRGYRPIDAATEAEGE